MTAAPSIYSGDPSASDLDLVRYKIDDVASPFQLTDLEILAELKATPALLAAYHCASKIATRYAKRVNKSISGDSISNGDLSKQWRLVASDLLAEYQQGRMGMTMPTIQKVQDSRPDNIPSRSKSVDIEQQDWSSESE